MFNIKNEKFTVFSKYSNLRLGSFYIPPNFKYKYKPFTEIIEVYESGKRPKGGINPADYGQAISLGGEQIGMDGRIDLSNIPYVSYDFYDKAEKGIVKNYDILICKDGALTGKTCIVDFVKDSLVGKNVMVNEHVYIIRCNSQYNQQFLAYLMQTDFFQSQIKDLAYRKKGQPGLNSDHIKALKVLDIPLIEQNNIMKKIEPLEKKINRNNVQVPSVQNLIDEVFRKEFKFDYVKFNELKKINRFHSLFTDFARNIDSRFSVKFHRPAGEFVLQELNNITSSKIKSYLDIPIELGASISPCDYDENGKYLYISMATIKSWEFDEENASGVSKVYSENNLNKTVKKGDIIMARSGEGTIGKVAEIQKNISGVFADFTMRIRLKNYNTSFAYYYFRTSYFQYLIEVHKKGLGNNTNIFPIAIQDFPIPDISLKKQASIVKEIRTSIDKLKILKEENVSLQNEIRSTIMDALQ